jgi:hypothetical protein
MKIPSHEIEGQNGCDEFVREASRTQISSIYFRLMGPWSLITGLLLNVNAVLHFFLDE